MASVDEEVLYYKINKLLWRWKRQEGARVVREASLSMDKAPPPLPAPPEPPVAEASAPKPPKLDPAEKLVDDIERIANAFSRFKTWLNTPEPPRPASPPKPVKKVETVPPFDIQEIPGAMRKEFMPISAKLMERWFAGRLNYSPTTEDEEKEINQVGKPYPPDMYDLTTVTLDWVLEFPRAKEKFDYLINKAIRSEGARKVLEDKFSRYKDKYDGAYKYRILAIENSDLAKSNPTDLHRQFQFQRTMVDGTFGEKIALLLKANLTNNGSPDDLTGALGSFNFYAAIATASISWNTDAGRSKAEVTGIYVYAKDGYTFTDDEGARSQYLGHWSKDRVIVVPYDAAAEKISRLPYDEDVSIVAYSFDAPVAVGDISTKGNVHYPVYNSSFRQWAIKHQRGGDFIVYTDRRFVRVNPPLEIYL
ncbi:DUF6402 family protein [Trinickia mobilis]|uniref:DUF6402 family protein n=1 Tax=Trinickia mobilis TaxID=2816356 RepID=UPI001A8D0187|nr:DUF6402 family protein [Trinickia mobilis]